MMAITSTDELIRKFDLEEAVAEFVRSKVAEVAGQKTVFRFEGSCRSCGERESHVPHVIGQYDTVRYGRLQRFCAGVPGEDLTIVYTSRGEGSAATPAYLSGFYVTNSKEVDNR